MGELRTLNETGDTKVIWDPTNDDEVDAAKAQFNVLKKKGFTAYSVKKGGEKNKAITEFDPDAGMIIMVPKIQGG
jgi:hypothetical protein